MGKRSQISEINEIIIVKINERKKIIIVKINERAKGWKDKDKEIANM